MTGRLLFARADTGSGLCEVEAIQQRSATVTLTTILDTLTTNANRPLDLNGLIPLETDS